MKPLISLVLIFSFLAVCSSLACDSSKAKDTKQTKAAPAEKAKKDSAATEKKGGTLLTGSYIKQNIRRNGRITDGPNQVIVIDRETIERSGASDLKRLLTQQGVH